MNAELELHAAILNKLGASIPNIFGADAPVLDNVDQDQKAPYITIGDALFNDFSGDVKTGFNALFTINVWSDYLGQAECKYLQGQVYELLNRADLTMLGYNVLGCDFVTNNGVLLDPNGITRHGIQQFRVFITKSQDTPSEITRYFRRNLGTTDYAQFAAPITLAGDLDIEFDALVGDLDERVLLGRLTDTNSAIFFSGATVNVRDLSGTTISAGTIQANTLHKIKIQVVGTLVTITIDGVSTVAGNLSGGFEFSTLYRHSSGGDTIWKGILANLKIWDNDTLITDCPIDEPSGATIIDHASGNNATIINGLDSDRQLYTQQETGEWLGQELVVNGGFDDGITGWESLGVNGKITAVNGGCLTEPVNLLNSARGPAQTMPVTIGSTYRVTGLIDAANWFNDTAHLEIRDPRTLSPSVPSGSVATEALEFTATFAAAELWVRCDGAPPTLASSLFCDNVSLKEVLKVA